MEFTSGDMFYFTANKILELRGVSGAKATVDQAKAAPQVVQAHAMSGNVYDLEYDRNTDRFMLIPNTIVWNVNEEAA